MHLSTRYKKPLTSIPCLTFGDHQELVESAMKALGVSIDLNGGRMMVLPGRLKSIVDFHVRYLQLGLELPFTISLDMKTGTWISSQIPESLRPFAVANFSDASVWFKVAKEALNQLNGTFFTPEGVRKADRSAGATWAFRSIYAA